MALLLNPDDTLPDLTDFRLRLFRKSDAEASKEASRTEALVELHLSFANGSPQRVIGPMPAYLPPMLWEGVTEGRSSRKRATTPGRGGPSALLFDALFAGQILYEYREAVSNAQKNGRTLLVRLACDSPFDELPWEEMFDTLRGEPLALSPITLFTRQQSLTASRDLPPIEGPLRVLALLPWNEKSVNAELGTLDTLCREQPERFHLTRLFQPRKQEALEALRGEPYHVLVFSGTMGTERAGEHTRHLVFAPPEGNPDFSLHAMGPKDVRFDHLATGEFIEILRQRSDLRFVYLSTIFSARLAADLNQFVPAAIGFEAMTSDETHILFTNALFEALGHGVPLTEATRRARQAVANPGVNSRAQAEWSAPRLFLTVAPELLFPSHAGSPGQQKGHYAEALDDPALRGQSDEQGRTLQRLAILRKVYEINLAEIGENTPLAELLRDERVIVEAQMAALDAEIARADQPDVMAS